MQSREIKINELYLSKRVTLIVPYRGKLKEIKYIITNIFGTEMQMTAKLRSMKYPCEIPKMEHIEIRLDNEFPSQELIEKIRNQNFPNKRN